MWTVGWRGQGCYPVSRDNSVCGSVSGCLPSKWLFPVYAVCRFNLVNSFQNLYAQYPCLKLLGRPMLNLTCDCFHRASGVAAHCVAVRSESILNLHKAEVLSGKPLHLVPSAALGYCLMSGISFLLAIVSFFSLGLFFLPSSSRKHSLMPNSFVYSSVFSGGKAFEALPVFSVFLVRPLEMLLCLLFFAFLVLMP